MKKTPLLLAAALVSLSLGSCNKEKTTTTPQKDYTSVTIPQFSSDSAFAYVQRQIAFGPRIPESKSHQSCATFLVQFFSSFADTVFVQPFSTNLYNGKPVNGKNIIASFQSEKQTRILLAAHWDSRLWADHDPDVALTKSPIDGANDGASGVGILMEIARVMKTNLPSVGIDIVLFDLEDQGKPEWDKETETNYNQTDWCLGSQFWSQNKHIPFYRAEYGVLLDMVGYHEPVFLKEEQSMFYASGIMNKVWTIARQLGYGHVFQDQQGGSILDDHVFVNRHAGIPMIDIVQHSPSGSFFPHWHTSKDNISSISPKTLKIVGDVLLTTIYNEKG